MSDQKVQILEQLHENCQKFSESENIDRFTTIVDIMISVAKESNIVVPDEMRTEMINNMCAMGKLNTEEQRTFADCEPQSLPPDFPIKHMFLNSSIKDQFKELDLDVFYRKVFIKMIMTFGM